MKLFHYTSREAALEHILPTGRLRFGRLPRTNDPREFAPIWFAIAGFVSDDDGLTSRSPFELIEEANALLYDSVHVLCFTEDEPTPPDGQRYGDGPMRARMWAQYADNHAGVCLCFDSERLISVATGEFPDIPEQPGLMHRRVRYSGRHERAPMRTLVQPAAEQDLRGFIESMVRGEPELFFTKDWDWTSEAEYRFLLRGNTKEEESIDIEDALEAVIAGPRFHPVYRPGLWRLCQDLGIPALQIQWEMGPPVVVKMIDPARLPLIRRPR